MKPIRPQTQAVYQTDRMGKATLFESADLLVGLNAFEPGQEHRSHVHSEMDKVYYVLEGQGLFLVADSEHLMSSGEMLIVPRGVKHGVRNNGDERLLVLAVLAPGP